MIELENAEGKAQEIACSLNLRISKRLETFTASIFFLEASDDQNLFLKVLKDYSSPAVQAAFDTELVFYREIYPLLPSGVTAPLVRTSDPKSLNPPSFVILRDLSLTHAALDWPAPPTVAQAHQAVAALARLHVTSHGFVFDPLIERQKSTSEVSKKYRGEYVRDFLLYLHGRLDEKHLRAINAISDDDPNPVTGPKCVLQGDSHIWNALYPEEGRFAVLVDWQDWQIGHPSYDLGYMLSLAICPASQSLELRERLFETYLSVWADLGGIPVDASAFWEDTLRVALWRAVQTVAWQWYVGVSPVVWTRTLSIMLQLPEYKYFTEASL